VNENKINASLSIGNQAIIHLSLSDNAQLTIDAIIKGAALAIVNMVYQHKVGKEEILKAFNMAVGEAYDETDKIHSESKGPKLVKP
jgi:hypothetical protein